MTSTIKVTSHNYPVRVQTLDSGRQTDEVILRPEDGERVYHTTTTRELRITDIDENELKIEQPSLGERLVRTTFNPSANSMVDTIKQDSARLINLIDGIKEKDPRLAALAVTALEQAAMWAVKLATA